MLAFLGSVAVAKFDVQRHLMPADMGLQYSKLPAVGYSPPPAREINCFFVCQVGRTHSTRYHCVSELEGIVKFKAQAGVVVQY